jgi:predicted dehydrogenase
VTGPDPVALAVVGAGRVARAVHVPLLRDVPHLFRVVAVVDECRARAVAAAARFPGAVASTDLDDAFAAGAVAVLCATPWYSHAGILCRALREGRQVLCEKPVTLDRTELRELIAAERASTATVAVGYMKRHDPAVNALLDIVRRERPRLRQVVARVVDPNSPRQVRALLPPDFAVVDSAEAPAAQQAISRALGTGTDSARRNAFAHAVGGSLVHLINLVHALLAGSGAGLAGTLCHATQWCDGRSVTCGWRPHADLAVQLSYVRVPHCPVYNETFECVTDTGLLTLSAGSPYTPEGTFTLRVNGTAVTPAGNRHPAFAEGFARQLTAWATALTAGAPALPGLRDAGRDLDVVHEVTAALE